MFERADWTLFRTVEGLQQKAGVPAPWLRRLVLKELGDNALDNGGVIRFGLVDGDPQAFFVEDDGPGLDGTPKEIADLLVSADRFVPANCFACRNAANSAMACASLPAPCWRSGCARRHHPQSPDQLAAGSDGTTSVVAVLNADHPIGTRIEINFGPALPHDLIRFDWVRKAQAVAGIGQSYQGRSSPFWYDAAQFHELLLACGTQPVRNLITQLDGCTGGKAGEIVAAAGLDRRHCQNIDRQQAATLLTEVRRSTRPVSADRLGHVGRDAFPDPHYHYAKVHGIAMIGGSQPQAEIPFVVEAWARKISSGSRAAVMISRSVFSSTARRARARCQRGVTGMAIFACRAVDSRMAGRTRRKKALTRSRSISPRLIARSRPTVRSLISGRLPARF